jgi:hypothetical protein
MPSVSVKDVDQQKFTVALAAFLKKWVFFILLFRMLLFGPVLIIPSVAHLIY